jgi:hypothetical protein
VRDFPDAESCADSDCRLLMTRSGLTAVRRQDITGLRME